MVLYNEGTDRPVYLGTDGPFFNKGTNHSIHLAQIVPSNQTQIVPSNQTQIIPFVNTDRAHTTHALKSLQII